jgi:hypothetical protein
VSLTDTKENSFLHENTNPIIPAHIGNNKAYVDAALIFIKHTDEFLKIKECDSIHLYFFKYIEELLIKSMER